MEEIKALFVDCDGVLYDKKECTAKDITVIGLGKTFAEYHLSRAEFERKRIELKKQGIRGVFNAVLAMCRRHHIVFDDFVAHVAMHTDYSRISKDLEMLSLLKQAGEILPVYIVTNNTFPHLHKIFSCLNGGEPIKNVQKKLNITFIPIEETMADGIFHSKKMKTQLANLCKRIGQSPQEVLLLDDSESIREEAVEQGIQITERPIETPADTKTILRRVINEKSKGHFTLRQACGRIGR